MVKPSFSAAGAACFSLAAALVPRAPLTTSNGSILAADGTPFQYKGVNWPGAADAMLPEGLNYQSVSSIVTSIKGAGFNSIRLSFAIQMIDDIYENSGVDITISTSIDAALGPNASDVLAAILQNNPTFTVNTTRLQVFDAIAAECNEQGIYVHLDNHVSKAQWCCSGSDGNAWFGDTHFDIDKWKRGLAYMAKHVAKWPSAVSIGLRNELRQSDNDAAHSYDWGTWYDNMHAAAEIVNEANPNLLIFMGGVEYDTTVSPVVTGGPLGSQPYEVNNLTYGNKVVLELHNYSWDHSGTDCDSLSKALDSLGFNAMIGTSEDVKNVVPVVMSELGYGQHTDEVSGWYATCLRDYLPSRSAGWMVWSIAGSNYIREGVVDIDDSFGILNHEWSDFRNKTAFDMGIAKMIVGS